LHAVFGNEYVSAFGYSDKAKPFFVNANGSNDAGSCGGEGVFVSDDSEIALINESIKAANKAGAKARA